MLVKSQSVELTSGTDRSIPPTVDIGPHAAEVHAIFYVHLANGLVPDTGWSIIDPVSTVVRLAHSRWPIAAGERASAVSGDERSADGQRDGAQGPTDVEGFGFSTQSNGNNLRVAGPPARPGMR